MTLEIIKSYYDYEERCSDVPQKFRCFCNELPNLCAPASSISSPSKCNHCRQDSIPRPFFHLAVEHPNYQITAVSKVYIKKLVSLLVSLPIFILNLSIIVVHLIQVNDGIFIFLSSHGASPKLECVTQRSFFFF